MKRIRRRLPLLLGLLLVLSACGGAGDTAQTGAPLTWQEQYDLGVRYLSEGKYEEAILAFTAAIEIDPRRAEAYMGRGDAHVSGGTAEDLAAAEADYLTALELDGQTQEHYQKLADLYQAMGLPEKAVEILRRGMERLEDEELFTGEVDEIMKRETSLQITDVQYSGSLTPGETAAFQITVEYTCPTDRAVVLYAGANSEKEDSYRLSGEEYFPPENSGTYTFTVSAVVPSWELRAYVNISEYPHAETWSPLMSTNCPVQ